MRFLPFVLLAASLQASAVVSTPDQIATLFCWELSGCEDNGFAPVPELPGYTLGPYVATLYLGYEVPADVVPYYPGTLQQFVAAELPGDEDFEENDGYAFFAIALEGDYTFTMAAAPEMISSIADPALSLPVCSWQRLVRR